MKLSIVKSIVKSALGLSGKTHLQVGQPAPELAVDEAGHVWTLAEVKGQPFVLYFYPKDDTPGCTKESCSFRDAVPAFGGLGVRVFGASRDDAASHRAFKQKYNLNFPLLIDGDGALGTRWGVEDGGISRRVSFLVDAHGVIRNIWDPVSVAGHAEQVASALKSL